MRYAHNYLIFAEGLFSSTRIMDPFTKKLLKENKACSRMLIYNVCMRLYKSVHVNIDLQVNKCYLKKKHRSTN